MRAMYYQKQDAPPPAPPRRSHTGWIVALVLLCLAAAAVFLILPKTQYGRYQKAVSQMEAGQYDESLRGISRPGGLRRRCQPGYLLPLLPGPAPVKPPIGRRRSAIYESLGDYRKAPRWQRTANTAKRWTRWPRRPMKKPSTFDKSPVPG